MILSTDQLNKLSEDALIAVQRAAEFIQQFDTSQLITDFKASGSSRSSQVVTQVDLTCQAMIIEQLMASCQQYDIALLSEENCADIAINEHARLDKDYFWCIDPLDGTLPFIEGRSGYAVSIALVTKKGDAVIAAIALPASNDFYHTSIDNLGKTIVYKNAKKFSAKTNDMFNTVNFYCDQSFVGTNQYEQFIKQVTKQVTSQEQDAVLKVTSGNGAVVNALSVLENGPAFYVKLPKKQQGGGALWDFSATACITNAIDAWVSDIHGRPLTLNQDESYYMNEKGIIYASNNNLAIDIVTLCKANL